MADKPRRAQGDGTLFKDSRGYWVGGVQLAPGPDGKRRAAEFVVPDFVAERELCQYLEDLFHESATPTNGDVVQLFGGDKWPT